MGAQASVVKTAKKARTANDGGRIDGSEDDVRTFRSPPSLFISFPLPRLHALCVASTGAAPGWRRNVRFHSLGSRECVVIAVITYPDPGTHRWSRARVHVSFDWTRMRRRNGPSTDLSDIAMHLRVDSLHRTSTKSAWRFITTDTIALAIVVIARIPRCTRALLSVPVPTAVLVLSLSGAAHRRTALPHTRSVGWSVPDERTGGEGLLKIKSESDAPLHTATAGTIAVS
ncbi:hypothetical protein K438DRAFT_1968104 [Mycena galopus ATCC 62051]|nr:hypothetical protein K438DRAFT_1968104 [Mycena galopus ATCC 62051]